MLVDTLLSSRTIELHPYLDERGRSQLHALDVGFGDSIVTTHELGSMLLPLSDLVTCTGVEIDEPRVVNAQAELLRLSSSSNPDEAPSSNLQIRACLGQIRFDGSSTADGLLAAELEVAEQRRPYQLIRCCNVLRGYDKARALAARNALLEHLDEGGVLLEGTTDVEGHLAALDWWEKQQAIPRHVGLVVATDFRRGFAPLMFRDVLPRYLRRDCVPGSAVFEWLHGWNENANSLRAESSSLAQLFERSLVGQTGCRLLWSSSEGAAAHLTRGSRALRQ